MRYVCSEIQSRGLNNERAVDQSEHFARLALSHRSMLSWTQEMRLVGYCGYQRSQSDINDWLRERREKTEIWLRAWQRLEQEIDPSFDINDRKQLPSSRVMPPDETHLPPGSPPSAIQDPRLRAQYEAAIADNNRRAERVAKQVPLQLHGPAFRTRAELWLIQAYSQSPRLKTELWRYLEQYVRDPDSRRRILAKLTKPTNRSAGLIRSPGRKRTDQSAPSECIGSASARGARERNKRSSLLSTSGDRRPRKRRGPYR